MKGWLRLWGKPVLPATTSMDWMLFGKNAPDAELARYLSDCRSSPGGMPGMASTQELNELRQLDGEARDQLFLRRSEEHTSELQSTNAHLVCRLLLEKKNKNKTKTTNEIQTH